MNAKFRGYAKLQRTRAHDKCGLILIILTETDLYRERIFIQTDAESWDLWDYISLRFSYNWRELFVEEV
jgi:hypothetical protein